MSKPENALHLPPFQTVVLAAGKGTRLKSRTSKMLHEIAGKKVVCRAIETALKAGSERVIVIVGHQGAQVKEAVLEALEAYRDRLVFVTQTDLRGTAMAVWSAADALRASGLDEKSPDLTLIISGDVPNLSTDSIQLFIHEYHRSKKAVGVITACLTDAAQYGRIIRNDKGDVVSIVEYKDANEAERAVKEINAGTYLISAKTLLATLEAYISKPPENAQNEWYLTVIVWQAESVFGWPVGDVDEIQGINTRQDLAAATKYLFSRNCDYWMTQGVTLIDPATTYLYDDIEIDSDVVIEPNVTIKNGCKIAQDCHIGTGCTLTRTTLGGSTRLLPYCVISDATIGANTAIGPFAHIRPLTEVGDGCKIGNFVEVKKSTLADGAKASHLTYLGDTVVGPRVNIGAGTITCNYDGVAKHQTIIEEGAFIGSNTSLIAPVTVGKNAIVGASSAITQDVPEDALALTRAEQRVVPDYRAKKKKSS